jgi:hypothetical protein
MSAERLARSLIPVALSVLLGACVAGSNFVRPLPAEIQLGKTTYNEVVQRLGGPIREERVRRNDRLLRVICYVYASEEEPAKAPGTRGTRQMEFLLSDDIVVGEGFASGFASDHTDFDESKVGDIVKGKSRCAEVVSRLGRPSVSMIYPFTEKPGETAIGYWFAYAKGNVLDAKTFEKMLMVRCDASGIVTDVAYSEEGDR